MKAKEYLDRLVATPMKTEEWLPILCRDLETEMGAMAKARHVKTAEGACRLLREFIQKADVIAEGLNCPPFFLPWISKHRPSLYRSFKEYEDGEKIRGPKNRQHDRTMESLRARQWVADAAKDAVPSLQEVADRVLGQLFVNAFLSVYAQEIMDAARDAVHRKK